MLRLWFAGRPDLVEAAKSLTPGEPLPAWWFDLSLAPPAPTHEAPASKQ